MDNFYEQLTENEKPIYHYIKESTENGKKELVQSYAGIGEATGTSSATVFRAVKKLISFGIVSVVPSVDKYKSNKIIFHGEMTMQEQQQSIKEIVDMISSLHLNTERFENILKTKDTSIQELEQQCEKLSNENSELKAQIKKLEACMQFDASKIISQKDLGNGTIAYLLKK